MCLILDTNMYGKFMDPEDEDMAPIKGWLGKGGRLVFSWTDTLATELSKHAAMREEFRRLERGRRLRVIEPSDVIKLRKNLPNLASDDPDILALAQAADVKVLATSDTDLHKDFGNPEIIKQGKIYQTKDHDHLLKPDMCR